MGVGDSMQEYYEAHKRHYEMSLVGVSLFELEWRKQACDYTPALEAKMKKITAAILGMCGTMPDDFSLPEGVMKFMTVASPACKNQRSQDTLSTFLHYLCWGGMVSEAKQFLESGGIDVNIEDQEGASPLMIIAKCNGSNEIAQMLLNAGAKLNMPDYQSMHILHHAAKTGHVGLIRLINVALKTRQSAKALSLLKTEGVQLCVSEPTSPPTATTKEHHDGLDVSFVNFDILSGLAEFPCREELRGLTIAPRDIKRDESLFIFISHSWLRPHLNCEGWSGRAHPDNETHDKFALCVRGIEVLWRSMAPDMKNCYVWMDYCCSIGDAENKVKEYDEVVKHCDLIFTPIVDRNVTWRLPANHVDLFTDYKSPLWNGNDPRAYLNRAWCRVEMLYAAHMPLAPSKHVRCRGALAHAHRHNRRPHLLYGHHELAGHQGPRILPPLRGKLLSALHPLRANSVEDAELGLVNTAVKSLQPLDHHSLLAREPTDERNAQGLHHGVARCCYINGDVFHGHWVDGVRVGQGTMIFNNGDTYEGEWKADQMDGDGVYCHADGSVYRGQFKNNVPEGAGRLHDADGSVYDGAFSAGLRHGPGKFVFSNGDILQGEWRHGTMPVCGEIDYANGSWYRGDLLNGARDGAGVSREPEGMVYSGTFVDNLAHGRGHVLFHTTNEEHDGEWYNGTMHGRGVHRYADGRELVGRWDNNRLVGGDLKVPVGDQKSDDAAVGGEARVSDVQAMLKSAQDETKKSAEALSGQYERMVDTEKIVLATAAVLSPQHPYFLQGVSERKLHSDLWRLIQTVATLSELRNDCYVLFQFRRPASFMCTTIWYQYRPAEKQWYWTPYETREPSVWISVHATFAVPFGIWTGVEPAWCNKRIITALRKLAPVEIDLGELVSPEVTVCTSNWESGTTALSEVTMRDGSSTEDKTMLPALETALEKRTPTSGRKRLTAPPVITHAEVWRRIQATAELRELQDCGAGPYQFLRPASENVTTLYYLYSPEKKQWFWTPYEQRQPSDWISVRHPFVPFGIWQGSEPKSVNQGIIRFLRTFDVTASTGSQQDLLAPLSLKGKIVSDEDLDGMLVDGPSSRCTTPVDDFAVDQGWGDTTQVLAPRLSGADEMGIGSTVLVDVASPLRKTQTLVEKYDMAWSSVRGEGGERTITRSLFGPTGTISTDTSYENLDSVVETADQSHANMWSCIQTIPDLADLRDNCGVQFQFSRPGSVLFPTIWYQYRPADRQWFWTPYERRDPADWIPVTELVDPQDMLPLEVAACNKKIILYMRLMPGELQKYSVQRRLAHTQLWHQLKGCPELSELVDDCGILFQFRRSWSFLGGAAAWFQWRPEERQWYWTLYEERARADWVSVSVMTVPNGVWKGFEPGQGNKRVILFLRDLRVD